MKHQWLAYVVVGVLSIGAGVAIAGLPNNVPVDATVIPPTTSTTVAAPTTSDVASTTEAATTEQTESSTTVTTTTVPTTSSTTSTTSTSTLPADGLPPRNELFTIVANGANISGAASLNVERLQALGYTDVAPRNGTAIAEFTTVYYADGLEDAAARLADDLDLLPDFVAPLNEAPRVLDLPDGVELLAYIGLDRAG